MRWGVSTFIQKFFWIKADSKLVKLKKTYCLKVSNSSIESQHALANCIQFGASTNEFLILLRCDSTARQGPDHPVKTSISNSWLGCIGFKCDDLQLALTLSSSSLVKCVFFRPVNQNHSLLEDTSGMTYFSPIVTCGPSSLVGVSNNCLARHNAAKSPTKKIMYFLS